MCTSLKVTSNLQSADQRVKLTESWDTETLVKHIWGALSVSILGTLFQSYLTKAIVAFTCQNKL